MSKVLQFNKERTNEEIEDLIFKCIIFQNKRIERSDLAKCFQKLHENHKTIFLDELYKYIMGYRQ